ncbi:MAG: PKD domain-containing protein [Patescibacteria group bacterium]
MPKKYLWLGLLVVSFLTAPLFLRAETSTADITRLIASLRQQIAELQRQSIQSPGQTGRQCFMFNRNLGVGASGRDVRELQAVLAKEGFPVNYAPIIPSASQTIFDNSNDDDEDDDRKVEDKKIENENSRTDRFTEMTAAAVSAFQEKYRSEILTPNGLTSPTGYVGPSTRRVLNRLYGCKYVIPPPSVEKLKVISPNGGEVYSNTDALTIKWESRSIVSNGTLAVELISGTDSIMVAFVPNTGSYTFQLSPEILMNPPVRPSQPTTYGKFFRVRVGTPPTTFPSYHDFSDSYFTIYNSNQSGNRPPVISGINGPTTLNLNQTGTWTVNASDPENGTLNYSVIWGDEQPIAAPALSPLWNIPVQQTASFTHTYSTAGTYYPKFKVTDNAGQSNSASLSVVVGQNSPSSITVTSPNGGEQWAANSVQPISWRYDGATSATKVDLYLQPTMPVCPPGRSCIQVIPEPIILDKNISANATYNWIVATDMTNLPISPGNYRINVCAAGLGNRGSRANCDSSDNYFTILPADQGEPVNY